jgi:GxxExxY protein
MKYGIQDQRTHTIIGCAMNVHNVLGNGFQEVIYQRSLAVEFKLSQIEFEREVERQIFIKANWLGQDELISLCTEKFWSN